MLNVSVNYVSVEIVRFLVSYLLKCPIRDYIRNTPKFLEREGITRRRVVLLLCYISQVLL